MQKKNQRTTQKCKNHLEPFPIIILPAGLINFLLFIKILFIHFLVCGYQNVYVDISCTGLAFKFSQYK